MLFALFVGSEQKPFLNPSVYLGKLRAVNRTQDDNTNFRIRVASKRNLGILLSIPESFALHLMVITEH